ncbi:signal peptide containing protein [Theileria equi strain WA]|uniref:Signal peptide containing protein n=1 Tax=Theileria equi strain WA TaxID=1537102 RepID=L1LCS0_THEEQ|nr:signal peptide containing protein [Theileria equi strain WA]EKX72963.1 signal peptide containing protein [Theileria equi strain WA]|eukprot:XP_004832415.1 signal peptide containing protein [Theileria equi strain WA]
MKPAIGLLISIFTNIFLFHIRQSYALQIHDDIKAETYTPLLQRTDVPSEIAKIITLSDKYNANVCFLRNTYLGQEDVPNECKCTFSRLQKIELECANQENRNEAKCQSKLCETCCILSLSSKFSKENNSSLPVNCKMRCLNSPIISNITEDSLQFLNDYLLKIDNIYHEKFDFVKPKEEKEVPTQYHVTPLKEKDDSL